MSDPQYIVGIDLGTTHCVLAYTEVPRSPEATPVIQTLAVPQLVAPQTLEDRTLLPSFLFLPGPHDVPSGGLDLPWRSADTAVGTFARDRGAELPRRLVSSAKSWLCHPGVDRTAPILPWDAPDEGGRKVSPVEASAALLTHLREAWNHLMAADDPGARLEQQELYLTVPASFDAVARELTVQAARAAGLEQLTLLEEPQAAFYAWLESTGDSWRDGVSVGDTILVCDIGGGTSDLSLIQVADQDGNLELNRVAVGNHILLGGDNMDLTLAMSLRSKLAEQGTRLDSWQLRGLWHACRAAKEHLLGEGAAESQPVAVLGRGSSLIGGTIKTELTRSEVESLLIEGFFPRCPADASPAHKARVGVREMGLPYETDTAITRHLAAFLATHTGQADQPAYPRVVLFNGGVTRSSHIRDRIRTVLESWAGSDVHELHAADVDQAVARGAATYGLARRGRGIRIKAGTAHTYYIGIESAMPAVPGMPVPMKALCVAPFGMEEGSREDIQSKEFGLVIGEPAAFHLLSSNERKQDACGAEIEDYDGQIEELSLMETELPSDAEHPGGQIVPVRVESRVTEVGTLELWCVSRDDAHRWKLEFNLKERAE